MNKRDTLKKPYWAAVPDVYENGYVGFPVGTDFNRDIELPGTSDIFPNGVVGIRVDDDFWCVGALPYEEYKDVSIEDIVAKFWPEATPVIFRPDSGDKWWKEHWKS